MDNYKISLSVCQSVSQSISESVTRNELKALQIAILHRSSAHLPPKFSPRRFGYLSFWCKSERRMSAQPEVELIFTVAPIEK